MGRRVRQGRLPKSVCLPASAGKPMNLSLAAEEVATFYGKMLDHEYTTKEVFQNNFFSDWRKVRAARPWSLGVGLLLSDACPPSLLSSGWKGRRSQAWNLQEREVEGCQEWHFLAPRKQRYSLGSYLKIRC